MPRAAHSAAAQSRAALGGAPDIAGPAFLADAIGTALLSFFGQRGGRNLNLKLDPRPRSVLTVVFTPLRLSISLSPFVFLRPVCLMKGVDLGSGTAAASI
jgi:hypothetical protein